METRKEKAVRLFKEGYNCSQSVFAAYSDLYGIDINTALRLSSSFGGGMGRMREVCGTVSGMFLVAGLETGAIEGKDVEGKKHNYDVVQQLASEFKKKNGTIICKELLKLDSVEQETTPEERTKEYYKKRPCVKLVEDAADIIEKVLIQNRIGKKEDITFFPVTTEEQIVELAALADVVWHEYFVKILTIEQIDYMVDKFQSVHAMTSQIKEQGYEYFFLDWNGIHIGYMAIHPEEEKLFLSKLYILKEYRGNGYASKAFEFLEDICKQKNYKVIWLTVNRFNENSIQVYKKKGFQIVRTQVADIGNNYVMDDYILEKVIEE